jgi:DNA-binding protein H-NS
MRHDVFGAMPIEELWTLHQTIVSILAEKLEGEKAKLQDRLDELNRRQASRPPPHRKVNPKFRNPERPSETWEGRGKQPHWVSELLEAGRNLDEFRIA